VSLSVPGNRRGKRKPLGRSAKQEVGREGQSSKKDPGNQKRKKDSCSSLKRRGKTEEREGILR